MSGFATDIDKKILLNEGDPGQVVGASTTDEPISREFIITEQDSLYFLADFNYDATVATAVTIKLQTRFASEAWVDGPSASASDGAGLVATIKLLVDAAADQTYLPLRPCGRFVVTTKTGDSFTVNKIYRATRL